MDFTWDDDQKGPNVSLPRSNECKNKGSQDKWQLVRSTQAFESGRNAAQIKITGDAKTSNTWRFIIGIIPSNLDCKGPKQWVGTGGSWGYIAGTGGKCHQQAKSLAYGEKFGADDVIGIVVDHDRKTVEFFRNGISQGIAFDNVSGPVHIAASMTGTDAAIQISAWDLPDVNEIVEGWDVKAKSQFMEVDNRALTVTNKGSQDKWQSCRSIFAFGNDVKNTPKQSFEIELVQNPPTPNSWQLIVGVVPPTFTCTGSKQWVGAGKSWGYIGGTGGTCYDQPQSVGYGEKFAQGDTIGVNLDFQAGTIEFLKNGVTQGIAHRNLVGPVHAAVSLTATGSVARLKIKPKSAQPSNLVTSNDLR